MTTDGRIQRVIAAFEPLSCSPDDDDEARTRKAQFTLAMSLIIPAGVLWGVIYWSAGARVAATMPLAYALLSGFNLAVLRKTRNFRWFQVSELALIVALPCLLQLALGGFVAGSAVVVWALLGPLFAVLFGSAREAAGWFATFAAAVVVVAVIEPSLTTGDELPEWLIWSFFAMNLTVVPLIAFAMLISFVRARDQLRALQRAYLDQTVMLREREKLATLGDLAAGVAHELNNPAAAVQRAAAHLDTAVTGLRRTGLSLVAGATSEQGGSLRSLAEVAAARGVRLSPVEQSEREQEMEEWLEANGVAEPWETAPALVAAGWAPADLVPLVDAVEPHQLPSVLDFLAQAHSANALSAAIGDGSRRISDIVGALRSYSYLDRGQVQVIDVTEGLESTLVLLQAKLRGMTVERRYAPDVPRIAVRGNELNQVWTNIVDNAIDATGGEGTIVIATCARDGNVVVDIENDGPPMPDEVAARVFEPFFTTKEPGRGTGLGMNISYNIVVRQHGGDIAVDSNAERTRFRVRVPVEHRPATPDALPQS